MGTSTDSSEISQDPLITDLTTQAPPTLDELLKLVERRDAVANAITEKDIRPALSYFARGGALGGIVVGGATALGSLAVAPIAIAAAIGAGVFGGLNTMFNYADARDDRRLRHGAFLKTYTAALKQLDTVLNQYERSPTLGDVVLFRNKDGLYIDAVDKLRDDNIDVASDHDLYVSREDIVACLAPLHRIDADEDIPNRAAIAVIDKEKNITQCGFLRANAAGKRYLFPDLSCKEDPIELEGKTDAWYLKPVLRDSAVVKPVETKELR